MAGFPVVAGSGAGEGIVNLNRSLNRAAIVLGAISIVSVAFMFVPGHYQLIQISIVGLVVALVLGLLAVVAGWLSEPALTLAAGIGFVLAAALQLLALAGGSGGFLGGNASTFSLWLALGVGLIVVGLVPRPEMAQETP
jgi:hypothetical protein